MKLKTLFVLLLAGCWGVGGWWWYTCKIKGFCEAQDTLTSVLSDAGISTTQLAANDTTAGDNAAKPLMNAADSAVDDTDPVLTALLLIWP
ncbi:MAG: hypothetical protein R3E95_10030 [Thiolinea sp.]